MTLKTFIEQFVIPNSTVVLFNKEKYMMKCNDIKECSKKRMLMSWMIPDIDICEKEVIGIFDTIIYDDNNYLKVDYTASVKLIVDTEDKEYDYIDSQERSNVCACACS